MWQKKKKKNQFTKKLKLSLLCFSDNSVQAEHPVKELERKYIRCSSRLTIAQVKKFLKVKLNLKTADQVISHLVLSTAVRYSA